MRRALLVLLAVAACRPATSPAAVGARAPASAGATTAAGIRYAIGGDSRQDAAHVIPWAFHEIRARGAAALIFLGDMELGPDLDARFRDQLGDLAPVPFYPVLGNHESVHRSHGASVPREDRVRAVRAFRGLFLGTRETPVESVFDDKVTYSVDLPGGVHFVALDNVSQPGFGADQIAWLAKDLEGARRRGRHVIVGMHRPLAGSGLTTHAMDEDGPAALADSAAALSLFEEAGVELIVSSHFHGFAEYAQHGIRSFITGGLGAPLDAPRGAARSFHHFLLVSVKDAAPLGVEVVRFPGAPSVGREDER